MGPLGEMYTLLRFQSPDALFERGVHEFDAWASAFGHDQWPAADTDQPFVFEDSGFAHQGQQAR
jgi:hypothetical protein